MRIWWIILSTFIGIGAVDELFYRFNVGGVFWRPVGLILAEGIVLFAAIWGLKTYTIDGRVLGLRFSRIFWGLIGASATWSVVALFYFWSSKENFPQMLHAYFAGYGWLYGSVYLVVLLLLVGPAEELYFRGFLFTYWARGASNRRSLFAAALASASLFGLFHIFHDLSHTSNVIVIVLSFLLQTIWGLLACYWFRATKTIAYPMLLHSLFDWPVTQSFFNHNGALILVFWLAATMIAWALARIMKRMAIIPSDAR